MAARQLRLHALAFGVGWLVVAFGALGVASRHGIGDSISNLPPALQGVGFIVVAVVAFPLAWPAYIAIAIFEAGLADRIRRGDVAAVATARVVLRAQAAVWMLGAVALIALVIWIGSVNGREFLVLMWLPLVVIALAHERTARSIGATS
jgi:hypothetical protein